MRPSIRRGFVVAAASAGLLALGSGAAQARGLPPADGTAGTATSSTASDVVHDVAGGITNDLTGKAREGTHEVTRRISPGSHEAHAITHRAGEAGIEIENAAKRSTPQAAATVRDGVEEAAANGSKEAGEAVPSARATSSRPELGSVPGVAAASSAASAPELPEGTVIEIPELVPGVPSIGILPLSLPELPVTPTVPVPAVPGS